MKRKTVYVTLLVAMLVVLSYFFLDFWLSVDKPFTTIRGDQITINLGIPAVVHQTWNTAVSTPTEIVRWRNGCMKRNHGLSFKMYTDEDLLEFTKTHYSRYLPMFEKLSGVYMADMARVLITYHYGGTYMDLDFYCHKPLRCVIQQAEQQMLAALEHHSVQGEEMSWAHLPRNVLIVSREPVAHAVVFRNKTRVVIQDFFMATPKHPFFLWLLEDRLSLFESSRSSASQGSSPNPAPGKAPFPKGPFSYSIERDIDRYYEHQRQLEQKTHDKHKFTSNRVDTDVGEDIIIELNEDTLHPLVDATNARLSSTCANFKHHVPSALPEPRTQPTTWNANGPVTSVAGRGTTATGRESSSVISSSQNGGVGADFMSTKAAVCDDMRSRRYFQPSSRTVMVHMWTHVYLGWSFVRGIYNMWTYYTVERALKPTDQC